MVELGSQTAKDLLVRVGEYVQQLAEARRFLPSRAYTDVDSDKYTPIFLY
jgi:hypothetical protein